MMIAALLCAATATFAGNCLDFDGIGEVVDIDNSASLQVGNTLTVEAWIRADDLFSRQGIFSTRYRNKVGAFQLEVGPGDGGSNRVAVSGYGTWVAETGDNALNLNEWTHIAYVRSSSSSQTLFVNGAAQTLNQESTTYVFADNDDRKLIASGTSESQFFDGRIDDLRIWNVARSSSEILDTMNTLLEGDEPGLVAFYRFDETSGALLPDGTANGNDGSLHNMEDVDWVASGAPLTVHGGSSPVHYVSLSGGNVWPYTNWIDAASNIQDAVDAAAVGDTVFVTNGTYTSASEITVPRAITLRSVNGWETTLVDGQNAHRCFYLGSSGCNLNGFTIKRGNPGSGDGGGVYCDNNNSRLTVCKLSGNTAGGNGGGCLGGRLTHCKLSGNAAGWNGGGCHGSWLTNCTLSDNTAGGNGGDDFSDYDEYIADTGPTDNNDWFHISGFSNNTVFFDSSSNRLYTLLWTTNLIEGVWIPAVEPRMGSGGEDFMSGTNVASAEFYKIQVKLP